jgi:hypothetical protein
VRSGVYRERTSPAGRWHSLARNVLVGFGRAGLGHGTGLALYARFLTTAGQGSPIDEHRKTLEQAAPTTKTMRCSKADNAVRCLTLCDSVLQCECGERHSSPIDEHCGERETVQRRQGNAVRQGKRGAKGSGRAPSMNIGSLHYLDGASLRRGAFAPTVCIVGGFGCPIDEH